MRFAQWLLPKDSTVFFGCVGNDENAKILSKAATSAGLRFVSQMHVAISLIRL